MDYRVTSVIDNIQRDLCQATDWHKVASSVGLSPSGLRLLFRQNIGVPPSKYLKHLRLERARELLCQDANKLVKEIMAAVGFSDESHFVRDFKELYGESPRQYRRHYFESMGSSAGESANKVSPPPTKFALRPPTSDV